MSRKYISKKWSGDVYLFRCGFSLGKETCKILEDLGGEVKEIHPVGSLFMEKNYFDRPKSSIDLSKIQTFDLLVVAAHMFGVLYLAMIDIMNYYLHFEWIKKFAIENPDLKIGIKHKNKLENPKELKIFEKINNVFHLIDETKWKDTYFWKKCKINLHLEFNFRT